MDKTENEELSLKTIIIEDNKTLNKLITKNCKRKGYDTKVAFNGKDGLSNIRGQGNEIILLDYDLPDMNAKQFIETLHKNDKDVPFLIMTGHGNEEIAVEMMRMGASDYIIKKNNFIDLLMLRLNKVHAEINNKHKLDKARKKIRASEKKHKALYNNAPLPYQSLNRKGHIVDVNPAWLHTLGYKRKQVIGKWFGQFLHPDQKDFFKNNFDDLKNQDYLYKQEYKIQHSEGHYLDISLQGMMGHDSKGEFTQSYCVFKNITEQKKAESELMATKQRYQKLFENSLIGIGLATPQGKVITLNRSFSDILGYSESELKAMNVIKLYKNIEDRKKIKKELKENDQVKGFETILMKKDGTPINVLLNISKIDDDGEVFYQTTCLDITEQKQTSEALEESKERYQNYIKHSNEGIYRLEMDEPLDTKLPVEKQIDHIYDHAYIAEFNDAFIKMYNASPEDFLNLKMIELHGGRDNPTNRAEVRNFVKSGYKVINDETVEKTADGKTVWFSNNTIGIVEDDKVVRMWGTQLDITERKQAEQRIKEQEENLRTTLNSIGDGVISTDLAGKIIRMNPIAEELTGWDKKDSLNQPIEKVFRIFNAKTKKELKNPVEKVFEEKRIIGLANHTLLKAKDGKEYQIADSGAPIKDDNGNITGAVLVFRNVTDEYKHRIRRRQRERELQEYKHRLEGTMRVGNLAWWEMDIKSGKVKFNQKKAQMLGYDPDEFSHYDDFMELVHPDDYDYKMETMMDLVKDRKSVYQTDYRIKTKAGHYKWFHDIGGVTTRSVDGVPKKVTGVVVDITEMKEKEQNLKFQSMMLNQIQDHITATDLEGNIIYVNDAEAKTFGVSKEELIGKSIQDYGENSEKGATQKDIVQQTLDNGHWRGEVVNYSNEGKEIIFDCRTRLIKDNDGNPKSMVGISTDITEAKKAENDLKKSEQRLKSYVENSPYGIFVSNQEGNYVDVNSAAQQITGYNKDELIGKNLLDLIPPEGRKEARQHFQSVIKGDYYTLELPFLTKSGTKKYWSVKAVKLSKNRFLAFVNDITDRKETEIKLKESEERYRVITEKSHDGIYILQNNKLVFANDRICDLIGYRKDELLYVNFWEFIHPEDLNKIKTYAYGRAKGKDVPSTYEVRGVTKNGEILDLEFSVAPITYRGKYAALGSIRDITQRKETQKKLKLRSKAIAASMDGIGILDSREKYIYINKAHAEIYGYQSPDELIGKSWKMLYDDEELRRFEKEIMPEFREKGKWRGEAEGRKKGGSKFPQEISLTALKDGGLICLVRDITERKKAEREKEKLQEQLLQTQKLESIGTLAGGVAHDFNNILTVIIGLAQLVKSRTIKSDPNYEQLDSILKSAERAADLTKQLLLFSRKKEMDLEVINLNRTISEIRKMLNRLIGENISMHNELASDLWQIKADRNQLEQVITNLVVNARDAMGGGGDLHIKTKNVSISNEKAETIPNIEPGQYVRISIEDTGHGMDQEIQDKIFDPFFTTKGLAEGTGMGLAVVHGIVKEHKGFINVYSEAGEGTIFHIYLPRVKSEQKQETKKRKTKLLNNFSGDGETVLIVEDEKPVLTYLEKILENYGYNYLSAKSGEEALELFAKNKDNIDLLLSDVIMTGIDGVELANKLKKQNKDLQVILSSGYSNKKVALRKIKDKGYRFIQKPYDITKLLSLLHETISSE